MNVEVARVLKRRAFARGLVVLSIALGALPAAAATSQSAAVPTLELAGHTTIHWRGTAVVRIHTSRDVAFPFNGGIRLVSSGNYAFIRMDPTSACAHDTPHCGYGYIDWTPAISDMLGGAQYAAKHGGRGSDIAFGLGDPESLVHGWSVFYLASDGESTLEFTTPDLHGQRDVRLTVPAPIVVQRLPMLCDTTVPVPCDNKQGYGSRVTFGGATHDVGTSGFAQALVFDSEGANQFYTADGVPAYQPTGLVGCVYGPGMTVSQDPRAEDHATGCDFVPRSASDSFDAVEASELAETTVLPLGSGRSFYRGDSFRRGPTYLGYVIDSPLNLPPPKWREAWGIWYRYVT